MYLNVIQLAESLGVPEEEIEDWVRREHLPAIQDRGRLLFDRAQVVEWAAARGLAAKAGFLAPSAALANGISLGQLLRTGGFWRAVPPAKVLETLGQVLERLPTAAPPVKTLLTRRAQTPDGINWTPLLDGIALPHLRERVALGRGAGLMAAIFLNGALELTDPPPDDVPVTRLLFFVAPTPQAHLDILARLSRAMARGPLRQLLQAGAPDAEILAALEAPSAQPKGGQ